MTNHALPASRVADYFFVAGLHDEHIIPTFENARRHQQTSDSDIVYYQQQERALSNLNSRPTLPPMISDPTFLKTIPKQESPSLLGVLDHVQNVIDNFDKERDLARDNVIAVDTEKYKRSESDRTVPKLNRTNTRKWRSPSDSKTGKNSSSF